MRIDRFSAVFGLAVSAALASACGAAKVAPAVVALPPFPLTELVRIPCPGPLVPGLAVGPGNLILVASLSGKLQAISPTKKEILWTFEGGPSQTGPVVDGDRIFWASNDGKAYGLDTQGKAVWTRTLDGPVKGRLRIVDNRLVFREGDKSLTALNAADGTIAWRDPASLPEEWISENGRIVVRTSAGRLRTLDPLGRLNREIPCGESAAGALGLAGDFAFLGTTDGSFEAYDLVKGKKKWSMRLGGRPIAPPFSDGRTIYVVLSNNIIAALRINRGDLLWWRPLSGLAAYAPQLYGNRAFVASRSPILQAFFIGNGTEETAFKAAGEILAPAEIVKSKIFLICSGEASEEAQILVLELLPPKPPEKPRPPEIKK